MPCDLVATLMLQADVISMLSIEDLGEILNQNTTQVWEKKGYWNEWHLRTGENNTIVAAILDDQIYILDKKAGKGVKTPMIEELTEKILDEAGYRYQKRMKEENDGRWEVVNGVEVVRYERFTEEGIVQVRIYPDGRTHLFTDSGTFEAGKAGIETLVSLMATELPGTPLISLQEGVEQHRHGPNGEHLPHYHHA